MAPWRTAVIPGYFVIKEVSPKRLVVDWEVARWKDCIGASLVRRESKLNLLLTESQAVLPRRCIARSANPSRS